jgi:hypothetical protein
MYKKGMTKEKFANKMRYFWTNHWKYQTIYWWAEYLKEAVKLDKKFKGSAHSLAVMAGYDLINNAVDKLCLEKLLSKDEAKRMRELFKSPDEENHIVALSIMASRKPKKFKDVK